MTKLIFNENDGIANHILMESLYTELLSDYVFRYTKPENPEKYLIATRQLPTCIEFVLTKKTRGYHTPDSKQSANKKTIIACAMGWGLSKLRSIPEFKDLIEGRINKSFEIERRGSTLI